MKTQQTRIDAAMRHNYNSCQPGTYEEQQAAQTEQRDTASRLRTQAKSIRTLTEQRDKAKVNAQRLADALKKQMWATEALNVLGRPDYIANQKSNYDEAREALAQWEADQ